MLNRSLAINVDTICVMNNKNHFKILQYFTSTFIYT